MFPVSLTLAFVSLVEFAVLGAFVGTVSGLLAAWLLGLNSRWILLDAILGLVGEFAMLRLLDLVFPLGPPWPSELVGALLVGSLFAISFEILRAKKCAKRKST
jgi:hypothetical protein